MDKIRAIIADDEPLARRGVRQLLAAHHFERVYRTTCHCSSKTREPAALLADLIEDTSANQTVRAT